MKPCSIFDESGVFTRILENALHSQPVDSAGVYMTLDAEFRNGEDAVQSSGNARADQTCGELRGL